MKRNHAFDLLCGICILRMIWLHVMSNTGYHHIDWFEQVMQWTYYFMCFFFFKAGYFNKSVSGDSVAFCIDKAKRLLVPYITWGLISSAAFFAVRWYLNDMYQKEFLKFPIDHLWRSAAVAGDPPLWFLFSFFLTYIVIHFIRKIKHLQWIVVLFPALSYWLFTIDNPFGLCLNNVPMGVYFFCLGHAWRYVIQNLESHKLIMLCTFMLGVVIILNLYVPTRYDMHANYWTGSFLAVCVVCTFSLCALSGILLSMPLPRIPLINFVGEHSMVYFATHHLIIHIYAWTHFAFSHTIKKHPDDAILIYLACVCICSWLVPYVERNAWLSGRFKVPNP